MKSLRLNILTALTATLFINQPVFADNAATKDSLTDSQVNQVKGVVHDYLVTNPQVLVEASQALQQQEMQKMAEKAKTNIVANADKIFADAASPVGGNAKGDVTLVEFFDYQCPHCKDMKSTVDKLIADDTKLRVVYKELPIFGQSSRDVAAIALASAKQGADKYSKLHDALLAAENPLSKDKALQIAKTMGLDTAKLAKDMNASDVQKQIDDNLQLAQSLNLMGTPTFIVAKWQVGNKSNDVKNAAFVPGMPTADELKAKIAAAR